MSGILGGSKPAGNTTTTTTSAPWAVQQPYLQQGFQQAANLNAGYTPQYYPNDTVAPMNSQETGALDSTYNLGMAGGSPGLQTAQNYSQNVMNGDYLNAGNPYFSGMVNTVAQSIQPQVDSQFEAAGRYGSGAAANAFASALTNAATNAAYNNYSQERNLQNQAAAQQPLQDAAISRDLQGAVGAGQAYQTQAQNEISGDQARWNYQQQLPYQQLQNYMTTVGGNNWGSSSTQSTPYFTNPTAGVLGLGSLGLAAYNSGAFNGLSSLFGSGSGTAASSAMDSLGGLYATGGMVGGRRNLGFGG